MFNLFFRRYVPGFRVGLDGVPGFNIDDNGLPQRASASSDGTLPDSAAQQYPDVAQTQSPPSISFRPPGAEGWVLSAPLIGSPGFRVSPQDDVPGLNVGPQSDVPGFRAGCCRSWGRCCRWGCRGDGGLFRCLGSSRPACRFRGVAAGDGGQFVPTAHR